MRAASLIGALVLAKALGLAERDLPSSWWLPAVLFWDDVAVGGAFWLVDRWSGGRRALWVVYWAIVAWAALNVPVVRALSSPLTARMLGAAGGPLSDSIAHYLTWTNAALVSLVFAAAALLPFGLTRVPARLRSVGAVAAVALVAAWSACRITDRRPLASSQRPDDARGELGSANRDQGRGRRLAREPVWPRRRAWISPRSKVQPPVATWCSSSSSRRPPGTFNRTAPLATPCRI